MYYYSLIFEEPFATNIVQLVGSVARIEEVLDAVYWALCTNPHAYDLVVPDRPIRLIKTKPYAWAEGEIPKLMIWYRIDEENLQVHLLEVKMQVLEN